MMCDLATLGLAKYIFPVAKAILVIPVTQSIAVNIVSLYTCCCWVLYQAKWQWWWW
jgi:hypothetical protein